MTATGVANENAVDEKDPRVQAVVKMIKAKVIKTPVGVITKVQHPHVHVQSRAVIRRGYS